LTLLFALPVFEANFYQNDNSTIFALSNGGLQMLHQLAARCSALDAGSAQRAECMQVRAPCPARLAAASARTVRTRAASPAASAAPPARRSSWWQPTRTRT
jgi:hypothetical protein